MPDNESGAGIDTAVTIEDIRQWIIELDAQMERIKADPRAKIDTAAIAAIRQRAKDLADAIQRLREARREP